MTEEKEVIAMVGLRQRMALFQQEAKKSRARQKKEERHLRRVGKLDKYSSGYTNAIAQSKTNSPLRASKPIFEVAGGGGGRGSRSEPYLPGEDAGGGGQKMSSRSSGTSISRRYAFDDTTPEKPKEVRDKEEAETKNELNDILQKEMKDDRQVTSYSGFRIRYLQAVGYLRPDEVEEDDNDDDDDDNNNLSKEERLKRKKERRFQKKEKRKVEADKRQRYHQLKTAWDGYDEKAQDKPQEMSPEDQEIEADLNAIEEEIAEDWQVYAEDVLLEAEEEQLQDEEDGDASDVSDSEDSDLEEWRREARRLKVEAAARRKRRQAHIAKQRATKLELKNKAEAKRAEIEAQRLMQEAQRLRDQAKDGAADVDMDEIENALDEETEVEESSHGVLKEQLAAAPNVLGGGDEDEENEDDLIQSTAQLAIAEKSGDGTAAPTVKNDDDDSDAGGDDDDDDSDDEGEDESSSGEYESDSDEDGYESGGFPDSDDGGIDDRFRMNRGGEKKRRKRRKKKKKSKTKASGSDDNDNDDGKSRKTKKKKKKGTGEGGDDDGSVEVKKKKKSKKDRKQSSSASLRLDGSGGDDSETETGGGKQKKKSSKDRKQMSSSSLLGGNAAGDNESDGLAGKQKKTKKKPEDRRSRRVSKNTDNGASADSSSDSDSSAQRKKKAAEKPIKPKDVGTVPARNLDGSLWTNPFICWANKPRKTKEVAAKIVLWVPEKTDFWRKTRHSFIMDNAPFNWHKVSGDFEVMVKITGEFAAMYDKAGLMVRIDEENWITSGVECFNKKLHHATCLTRDFTDWSLSPLEEKAKDGLFVCLKRIGDSYESFYSFNGNVWQQTRQGMFPNTKTVKVGIFGACPMGESYKVTFDMYRCRNVG